MSHSDNLYSGNDDSDVESFGDELSPTDGYFHGHRNMPTHMMVPDPSQRCNSADDKVLIARREARSESEGQSRSSDTPSLAQMYPSAAYASPRSSNTVSSPAPNTPASPVSPNGFAPVSPAPPPAYSVPPAGSLSSPVLPESRTYSAFEPHMLEHGFSSNFEPESMGRPIEEADERTPLSRRPTKKTGRSRIRTIVQKLLFLALVFAVISGIMTSIFSWNTSTDDPSDTPVTGSYCTSATYQKDNVILEFDDSHDLNIAQVTHEGHSSRGAAHVRTAGEIRLRRLPKDSTQRPHFALNTRVSNRALGGKTLWDKSTGTFKISTPKYARLRSSGPHCISVEITAWIPEGFKLNNLEVSSVTLSLRVFDDLNIEMSGYSKFSSISGDIFFPKIELPNSISKTGVTQLDSTPSLELSPSSTKSQPPFSILGHLFASRRIDIETVSGMISGLYPLYDHLGLYSQSGSVVVGVFPHVIDPQVPASAELDCKTSSSSINIHLPVLGRDTPKFRPPPRDYVTHVQSTAGSIDGSFYLGTDGTFKSTSGGLRLTILPVTQPESKSVVTSALQTDSKSGTTDVEILDPIFLSLLPSDKNGAPSDVPEPYQPIGEDDPYQLFPPPSISEDMLETDAKRGIKEPKMRSTQSTHASISGSISVSYPQAWEGTISAKAISGSLDVSGKGVQIIREKNGWGSKEVVAKKGVDNEGEGSSVNLHSIAGGLQFRVS